MVQQKAQRDSKWTHRPVQLRSQQTMQRILDATERLMAKRPFREISVAEIAQEAKASPTSLYARFENKQALLGALFERHARSQREMMQELTEIDRWDGIPLAVVLRRTFPVFVAGYRQKQGLIRAMLEQASEDRRFREDWSAVGKFIQERVWRIVQSRPLEVRHPDPARGLRWAMGTAFSMLAMRILMHEIDSPEMDELTEELTSMMLRYMGIDEAPEAEQVN